jgi:heme/copper-type cytochrome/quinol oxidase subunit 2
MLKFMSMVFMFVTFMFIIFMIRCRNKNMNVNKNINIKVNIGLGIHSAQILLWIFSLGMEMNLTQAWRETFLQPKPNTDSIGTMRHLIVVFKQYLCNESERELQIFCYEDEKILLERFWYQLILFSLYAVEHNTLVVKTGIN